MLVIKLIMNSAVEDVLAFKTCCGLKVTDQNLEILVTNEGNRPVTVNSRFDLELEGETRSFVNLLPQPNQKILPGEIKAFYCQMDEELWKKARRLVLFDSDGNQHPVGLDHG
jgi:hypothetical protein